MQLQGLPSPARHHLQLGVWEAPPLAAGLTQHHYHLAVNHFLGEHFTSVHTQHPVCGLLSGACMHVCNVQAFVVPDVHFQQVFTAALAMVDDIQLVRYVDTCMSSRNLLHLCNFSASHKSLCCRLCKASSRQPGSSQQAWASYRLESWFLRLEQAEYEAPDCLAIYHQITGQGQQRCLGCLSRKIATYRWLAQPHLLRLKSAHTR